ncbi:non-structural maintenance of chromosomes element 4 homolog A, partial [Tanacetum coccineum]
VHQLTCVLFRFVVQKPREQVADVEALLDITNTLVTFVKAQSNEGVTARDFVSSLLKGFVRLGGGHDDTDGSRNVVKWKKLGIVVSHVFDKGDGCCTMLGPMNSEVKQRKVTVHRKQSRLTEKETCFICKKT